MHYLRGTAADGASAPVNLSGIGSTYGTVSTWASANTAMVAGLVAQAFEGCARGRQTPAIATFGSANLVVTARVNAGAIDIRLVYALPYVRKTERGTPARAVRAVHTLRDDLGGPLVGPTFTGTVANGQTLTGRPGAGWCGESRSFAYQWQRTNDGGSTVADIGGATALAYVISGQSGYQLRMRGRGTNALSSEDAFTAWSSAVA